MIHNPLKRLIFLIPITLLALTACGGDVDTPGEQVPTSTPIPTAPAIARPTYIVQRGDVQEILTFTGRWLPRDQMQLTFEIAGNIRQVTVQRDDTIVAGQLLADLQITELENQLASAELDLEAAQAGLVTGAQGATQSIADAEIALANARLSLESTKMGNPWTSVESARITLDGAEQAVINAQRDYDEAITKPDQPAANGNQAYESLLSAKDQLRSAQAGYDSAAQSYATYQFQIAQAENAVIQAELALDRARSGESGDPSKQQAVLAAQLRVDQINASIAESSLYAPIDAQVLEVMIRPGDAVQAFAAVIVIGLPEPKEAIATLALGDAQKLSVGLVGTCQVMNRPETAVQCVVRQIPLSARDADQTTRVAATLHNVPNGQVIEVQMPLQIREDVLWLPPGLIRTFQNRTFVVLETPDGPRRADVVIGLQTPDRVEIVSGVQEGDVVISP